MKKLIIKLPFACNATGSTNPGQTPGKWDSQTVYGIREIEVILGDGGIRLPEIEIKHFDDVKMPSMFKRLMQAAAEEAILAPFFQGTLEIEWRDEEPAT